MTEIADEVGTVEPRSFEHDPDTWQRKAELVGVNYPRRTIELIVIPYEVEALVPWDGRMVKETICRGAFDGIERRANRIRANRDHDEKRTFGRAVTFHPGTEQGLVAVVKAARTALGDETLELADDGCLDASAGFVPKDGGMRWMARSAYQITKGWLRHIALVPEAAYDESRVLAVRNAQRGDTSKTPNLDEVLSWRLEDQIRSALP